MNSILTNSNPTKWKNIILCSFHFWCQVLNLRVRVQVLQMAYYSVLTSQGLSLVTYSRSQPGGHALHNAHFFSNFPHPEIG